MLSLFDKVCIKSLDLIGTIVDVSEANKKNVYIVESDTLDIREGYGGKWKLFDCTEEEIEKI
ncbi:MAG: hypothetical protein NC202_02650 [Roseburia sp.]|nr:hypothetical protein [Roseburia sp.]